MVMGATESNKLLDAQGNVTAYAAPTSTLLAICNGNPGTADAPANEVTGPARQAVTWTTAASQSSTNANRQDFTGVPAVTVTNACAVGVYAAGTRQQVNGALTTPAVLLAGQTLSFLVGSVSRGFT